MRGDRWTRAIAASIVVATVVLAASAAASWTGARAELRRACAWEAELLTLGPRAGAAEERALVQHLRRCGADVDLPGDGGRR